MRWPRAAAALIADAGLDPGNGHLSDRGQRLAQGIHGGDPRPTSTASIRGRYRACMSGAPVRILGWDERRQVWLARREGEASFVWVQDFGDAYQAARVSRGVDLVVPAAVYREWIAAGDAPEEPPQGVRLSGA
jgi:hypothetical protein